MLSQQFVLSITAPVVCTSKVQLCSDNVLACTTPTDFTLIPAQNFKVGTTASIPLVFKYNLTPDSCYVDSKIKWSITLPTNKNCVYTETVYDDTAAPHIHTKSIVVNSCQGPTNLTETVSVFVEQDYGVEIAAS